MLFEYLKRGVGAGVIAGVAYAMYVAFVANPLLNYIHDVGHDHDDGGDTGDGHSHSDDHTHEADHGHAGEHAHSDGQSHGDDPSAALEHAGGDHVVSETTNALVSVGSGVLWGILLAAVFAVAYYLLEPALPGRRGVKAAVLGAAGFFSISAVPWLVLPPAAPGAEESLGIDARLGIYAALIGLGALVSALSIVCYRRLESTGRARAVAAAAVPVVLTVGILAAVSPTIITHPDVPENLVRTVQGGAFLSQAGLWTVIVGVFARLHGRGVTASNSPAADFGRDD